MYGSKNKKGLQSCIIKAQIFCMDPYHRSTNAHNTYTSQEPAAGLGADLWARGPADLKIGEGIHLCMSYHIHFFEKCILFKKIFDLFQKSFFPYLFNIQKLIFIFHPYYFCIIDIFKKNHLPTFMAGGTSFMFNYPNIVRPSFITPAGSNPDEAGFMTTFEYCAITSVHINYSPQGAAPAFYAKSHAPVFIQLQINLQELNIRLGDRYGGELTGDGGLDKLADQFKQLAAGAKDLLTDAAAAAKTNPIAAGSGETATPPKTNP
jgi:hypothetical protein